jgi:hypothetical protein
MNDDDDEFARYLASHLISDDAGYFKAFDGYAYQDEKRLYEIIKRFMETFF